MGFFQDLKEDLSQAVNELMPDELLVEEENQEEADVQTEEMAEEVSESEEAQAEEQVSEIAIDPAELEELLGENEKEEKQEDSFSPDMVADIEAALAEAEAEIEAEAQIEAEAEMEAEAEIGEMQDSKEAVEDEAGEENDEVEEIEEIEDNDEDLEKALKAEMEEAAKSLQPFKFTPAKEYMKKEEKTVESKGDKKMTESTKLTGVATDETAVITAGMTINGDISSKGSIDVLGTINGNVESLGKLDIAGTINGDSKAAEIYAENANITGEVRSEGAIKIGQSSVIIGNIYATSAVIAGAVKGDIDVKGPVVLDTTAIVMGNIKSKSVQINNGAVIEGLCSQCYAEVNPTAFFEDLKKKK